MSISKRSLIMVMHDVLRTTRSTKNSGFSSGAPVSFGANTRRIHFKSGSVPVKKVFLKFNPGQNQASGYRAETAGKAHGYVWEWPGTGCLTEEEFTRLLIAFCGNNPSGTTLTPYLGANLVPPLIDAGIYDGNNYREAGWFCTEIGFTYQQSKAEIDFSWTLCADTSVGDLASPGTTTTFPVFAGTDLVPAQSELGAGNFTSVAGLPAGCSLLSYSWKATQGYDAKKCAGQAAGAANAVYYGGPVAITHEITAEYDPANGTMVWPPDPTTLSTTGISWTLGGLTCNCGPTEFVPTSATEDGERLCFSASAISYDNSANDANDPIFKFTGVRD